MIMTPIDLTGQKIGYLTIEKLIPYEERKNSYKRREWLCKCDCGKEIVAEQRNLTGKKYTQMSCGCIREKEHLIATSKYPLEKDFVYSFQDFKKYSFLHKSVTHSNSPLKIYTYDYYKEYIKHFYNDEQFNLIYNFWLENNYNNITYYDWSKPSLDHKIPLSKGGSNKIENLEFLTVFENLAKRDMTLEEWEDFKEKTQTTSNYFIEKIRKRGDAKQ
jgi:5-methylcytosine-specific restriction endonuclease McrA